MTLRRPCRSSSPDVVHPRDAAADGDLHRREAALQLGVEGRRGAAQHAVARNVGADDLCKSLRKEALDQFGSRERRAFQPAPGWPPRRRGYRPEDQPFGPELRKPFGEAFRFADSEAAADGAAGPGVEDAAQRLAALDAAAVLHFEPRPRRTCSSTARLRGSEALAPSRSTMCRRRMPASLEAQGRFERVAVVGFPAGVVALRQAHALAVDDVRCRYDFDHGVRGLGNSVRSARPPARSFRGGTACRRSCRGRAPR